MLCLRERSRPSWITTRVLLAVVLVGLGGVACGWWDDFKRERDANVQANHGFVLLEGYSRFRTLLADVDTGIDWFEYRLPDNVEPLQATTMIAEQIEAHGRCFQVVEAKAYETRLRCAGARSPDFREYLIAVVPQGRRVLAMYASIDSDAERIGYPLAIQDFRAEAKSGS